MPPLKRFCLIGHPVAGSLSPVLMEAAYRGRFSYDLVDEDLFENAWDRGIGYDAFNVTAPYKRDAYGMTSANDRHSSGIAACNLVTRIPAVSGGCFYHSHNTDVDGVAGAISESCLQLNPAPRKYALVVGTGGAAAAAHSAVVHELNRFSIVAGRNVEKARQLATTFIGKTVSPVPGRDYCGLDPLTLDPELVKDIDLIIYTLPGSAPVPEGLPFENAVVLEAEYRKPRLADVPCRQYISGKLWLLHQAIAGFRIMTGAEPDIPAMREVLGINN